ncbi:Tetratricopeptide repeat protein [Labrenzia sp. THAF191b]|uniref:tetratricopeptide repeat protein n=1 Tax=unclassified Labrenzia TaxID=2648686 RepID=UPI0012693131|nr:MULTISPECIES: tetratricopeptide repeat protein [unclassified Labrenzia]QFS98511.1 Tetratricopeptide repeat protein [Labrenzia sp. THAF191b]QFT04825.1 Tetratricopeptide repeat protein [Labrenzia sp. THAF191a]QFT16369.1 Tetratricopeptide repeat protein [Labrenzia sp. THAF187b]
MTRDPGPLTADDLYEMALRSFGREQCATAIAYADACLKLAPDFVDAWLLQAEVHLLEERDAAALACLTRAASITPPSIVALHRLAAHYLRLGRPENALAVAEQLKNLQPDDPEIDYVLAVARSRSGRHGEAFNTFQKLLRDDPDDAGSAIEASWLALGQRDYRRGWPLWEHRFGAGVTPAAVHHLPFWDGSPPTERKILVLPEGGHGDIIWAARFLPALKAAGASVHFLCLPALSHLLQNLQGVDIWVENAEELPGYGCELQISLLSLPYLLGVDDPSRYPPPRLKCDPAFAERRNALLARARAPLRVGILWSGNVDYGGNADRAAHLSDFLPLAELPFVQLYSLQKGPPHRQLIEGGLGDLVIDCDDFDFAETAAMIQSLDVIVMTDSAVGHIAGAIGTPVWLLLDTFPHWYHCFEGDRSDWYPGMRFFRQQQPRDWSNVIRNVGEALKGVAESRGIL